MFRHARSIRAKLALLIAASVGAAVLLSFAVSGYRELARFGEAKRAESQATAEVLAAGVADAVAAADRAGASRLLNAIRRIPDVKFAEIEDRNGAPFVGAGGGVALAPVDGGANDTGSLWSMLRRGAFFVTADIVKGGERVGSLTLLVDTSALSTRLRQALWAAALSAAAAIGVGLLIASRLQRSITLPLRDLAATMNRVRVGNDFKARAERKSDDETGQLVDAFNDMLGQIQHRDASLEAHRAGLERTVQERTHELADARDVAESANRAKSDFLATMSHEIRTPMNGMLVMAELLAGSELPARQQRYAETIARSGQTLLAIINDILDLSKIEAGKLELEQGRVSIATLVEDVLGLFWEKASSKRLDMAAEIAADAPLVIEADPVRLSQILSNLVGNALKFTETGSVTVTVSQTPVPGTTGSGQDRTVELRFCVEDTGVGIPADKAERIFEAFSQADQSTTRRYGGTGLGLSICERLVKAMGGRIWVESEPGKGSRFLFTIRAAVLEGPATLSVAPGKSAIVAVNGDATGAVLRNALRAAGYHVQPGAARIEHAATVFAGPDWIEANAGMLRDASPRPAVICVASVGNSLIERLLAGGSADGALMQPVSSARVRETLAAIEAGNLASLLAPRQSSSGPELPDLAGLKVLVADDSAVNREVVTEALSRLSVRTRTVEDGAQALDLFTRERFDLVLMDCSMPVMDGFAATRAIRTYEAEAGIARTPVLALTAHLAGGAADSWRDAGMDDYLTKPFTIRSLADCLARWRPDASGSVADPEPDVGMDASTAMQMAPGEPAVAFPQGLFEEFSLHPEAPAQRASKDHQRALDSSFEARLRLAPQDEVAEASPRTKPETSMDKLADGPLDAGVLESLRAIAGGNGAMLGKIFGLFRSHAPARLAALQEAVAAGDLPRAASEAHALKSPSLNVGALKLGALCAALETDARAGWPEAVAAARIEAIAGELAAVIAALDEQVSGGQPVSPPGRAPALAV